MDNKDNILSPAPILSLIKVPNAGISKYFLASESYNVAPFRP